MLEGLSLQHWRWEPEEDGYGCLVMDKAKSGANVFSREVMEELGLIVERMKAQPPKGIAIISGKPSGFIAGADIKAFQEFKDANEARAFIQQGHEVYDRLEALPCPTVAAIHGFCMGGGLELALACTYRICTKDDQTKLSLPEVRLGIHPGWGGTWRLPQRIGAPQALNAILTGRSIYPKKALKLGLVQYVVPHRHLRDAALEVLRKKPEPRDGGFTARLSNSWPARQILSRVMEKKTRAHVRREHYPAPFAVIDLWREHGGDKQEMLRAEIDSITRLAFTDTAKNLVRVFFLREQLKAQGGGKHQPVKQVHVIGAGTMGGDIAAWCALSGLRVSLQDLEPEPVAQAIGRAHKLFKKELRKPRLIQAAMDRLSPDVEGKMIPGADLVIEAIVEDLKIKTKVFKGVETQLKADAMLATNTSSIPLNDLAKGLKNPKRLLGLHFFNPVAKMPLVEVVHHDKLDADVAARGASFVKRIDRLPLPVAGTPGFLVNRILMPYMLEAVHLYSEGVPGKVIDREAERFGMPMGPIELADVVGLDVAGHVAHILSEHLGVEVPKKLDELLEAEKRGRKDGEGFYVWENDKPKKPDAPSDYQPPEDLQDRLIFPFLNESVACVRLNVVENADLLDAGIIFGTGFAPFRGGPMQHIRKQGADKLKERMETLAQRHGKRFKPDAGWDDL